jgi:AmiR/NasT family two-component response regulator
VGGKQALLTDRLLELSDMLGERNSQLRHALESRVVIEQAKGILAERFGLGLDEAFETLRSASRANGLKLRVLAARVVEEDATPHEILRRLRRG